MPEHCKIFRGIAFSEAAILVPNDPEQAALILREILKEIAGAKYYRPAKPRASQPGVNKSPSNKRQTSKEEKMLRKRLSQQHWHPQGAAPAILR